MRAKIAVHVCFGNLYGRPFQPVRSYRNVYPALHELTASQIVLEYANRGTDDLALWKEFPTDKELGAGVIDVKAFKAETADDNIAHIFSGKAGIMLATVGDGLGSLPDGFDVTKFQSTIGAALPPLCTGCQPARRIMSRFGRGTGCGRSSAVPSPARSRKRSGRGASRAALYRPHPY